jgi:NTP pyrophosphatase (non-canonical NTP hydrolase)
MVVEECGELLVALAQWRRDRVGEGEVIDEIADMYIMLGQLSEMFGTARVRDRVRHKLDRLEMRLEKTERAK